MQNKGLLKCCENTYNEILSLSLKKKEAFLAQCLVQEILSDVLLN